MTVMNEVNARTADRAAGARAIRTAVLDDLQRQHRISQNGLRAVLSGARWLSGRSMVGFTGESARKSSRIVIVNASIDQAAINLGMTTLIGTITGFERQWRQRMAGLRTKPVVEQRSSTR
jgi:hypothetical protein